MQILHFGCKADEERERERGAGVVNFSMLLRNGVT